MSLFLLLLLLSLFFFIKKIYIYIYINMGGGLMQLVAYGAQDIYLTGNPQITFFKVVYRRHTNFSMETIEQTLNGTLGFGNSVSCTISRNGDLLRNMYVSYVPNDLIDTAQIDAVPDSPDPTVNPDSRRQLYQPTAFPRLGTSLLKEINLEIGGQEIDRHYAHWLSVREDLFEENMRGSIPYVKTPSGSHYSAITTGAHTTPGGQFYYASNSHPPTRFQQLTGNFAVLGNIAWNGIGYSDYFVPLQFWFCKNPGLALPLIALQYHEVKINWTLPQIDEISKNGMTGLLVNTPLISNPNFSNVKLFADYIYLDTDERRRFAQVSHEYLIEQLQTQDFANDTILELNLNHPVKELIWYGVPVTQSFMGLADQGDGSLGTARLITDNAALKGNSLFSKLTTQQKLDGRIGDSHYDVVHDDDNNGQLGGHLMAVGHSKTGYHNTTSSSSEFNITLKLNGHERFAPQGLTYFTRKQIYEHHTGPGSIFCKDAICVYSFALKPEEHQPSGTCNFSRIDNAQLVFNRKPKCIGVPAPDDPGTVPDCSVQTIRVYAINYNVLRIMSGMGGLAYSN